MSQRHKAGARLTDALSNGRRFLDSSQGNVAILFGLMLTVLTMLTGLAIEYGRMVNARQILREMADSAALAAVAREAIIANATPGDQMAHSQLVATEYFKYHPLPEKSSLITLSPQISRVGDQWQAAIEYQVSMPLYFGGAFGLKTTTIGGTSVAVSGMAKFIDLYILVDTSVSMGIGATSADQQIMLNGPAACTVACHINGTDTIARSAGATLRIDVVKAAIDQVVAQAQSYSTANIRIGLYTFANSMTTQIDITSNLGAVKAANDAMELSGYDAGTNAAEALNRIKSKIGAAGDGSSASSPLAFVLLATDGVGNAVDNTDPKSADAGNWIYSPQFVPFGPHAIADPAANPTMDLEGLNPVWCQPIKDLGAQMMTLETKYIISSFDFGEKRYAYIKSTLAPNISAMMQACASSPDKNISADTPAEIKAAMVQLFSRAVTSAPRLTQ